MLKTLLGQIRKKETTRMRLACNQEREVGGTSRPNIVLVLRPISERTGLNRANGSLIVLGALADFGREIVFRDSQLLVHKDQLLTGVLEEKAPG
jgi:hypothetical protein